MQVEMVVGERFERGRVVSLAVATESAAATWHALVALGIVIAMSAEVRSRSETLQVLCLVGSLLVESPRRCCPAVCNILCVGSDCDPDPGTSKTVPRP